MNTSVFNTLLLFIILQLLLLVTFLFTHRRGRKLSNRLLAGYFLLLGINLTDGLLGYSGFYEKYPALAHLEDGSALLLGPLLYFYVLSVVRPGFAFSGKVFFHFLPFLLFTVTFQITYHSFSADEQQFIQQAIHNQTLPWGFYVTMVVLYGHVVCYFVASLREISRYELQIRNLYSDLAQHTLKWLRFLIAAMLTIILVSFINVILPFVGSRGWFVPGFALLLSLFFLFVNAVVFKGLQQPQLFAGLTLQDEQKYKGSPLTSGEKDRLHQQLKNLMETQKPWLNPDLSLEELAKLVETTPKKLSQVINEVFEQSFFDYINTHRIKEAASIFDTSTDPKLTVLEVLYLVGFNSKSSFNSLFKKKLGVTPSAYRQHALEAKKMRTTS